MIIYTLLTAYLLTIIFMILVRGKQKMIESLSIVSILTETVCIFALVYSVVMNGTYDFSFFTLNPFSTLIFLLTGILGLISTFYGIGYLRGELTKDMIGIERFWQTLFFLQLFLLSTTLAITTKYPLVMWIAIEGSTLSTVFVINFFHRPHDIEVSWKYLVINTTGLLLALLGTFIFSAIPGNHSALTWDILSQNIKYIDPVIVKFAFVFVLIGYGTKMGLTPMHTWKPDAYNKGPIPITALLSTVLVNISLFAVLQYRGIVNQVVDPNFTKTLFIFFGTLSVVIGALSIFTQKNYKRLLAYSSIENAGLMLLSFGLGGMATLAGILHMIYHSFSKSLLFYASGSTGLKYSSSKIEDVKGMLKVLPITSVIFLGAVLSIVGIPPFGIFVSEFYTLLAAFGQSPIIGILILLSLVLVFVGFIRMIFSMVYSEAPEGIKKGESSVWMSLPMVSLFVILLISGFYLPAFVKTLIAGSVTLLK